MGHRMGDFLVTVCGVFGIVGFLIILFCHYFQGWTWTRSYIFNSTTEEKMVLTKPGHFDSNGCMISNSDSEFNVSGRGSFRRFDKTDCDYSLLRQGSCTSLSRPSSAIPPQPLRIAPVPPCIGGPSPSQVSFDSAFTTAPSSPALLNPAFTIPLKQGNSVSSTPPQGDGGGSNSSIGGFPNFSSNNPFLPLIQASTQFLSQKFQALQQPAPNGSVMANNQQYPVQTQSASMNPTPTTHPLLPPSLRQPVMGQDSHRQAVDGSLTSSSCESTSTAPSSSGLSMGEILFSSPPAYSILSRDSTNSQSLENREANLVTYGPVGKTSGQSPINQADDGGEQLLSESNYIQSSTTVSSETELVHEKAIEPEHQLRTQITQHPGMPNMSTKVSEPVYKKEHHGSPTRMRDRQRKMEFTLQHLQSNQEERSISKKHYNPDSSYPISTSYVPKTLMETGTAGIVGTGGNIGKPLFRSPYNTTGHHSVVPPLTEVDEPIDSSASGETIYTDNRRERSSLVGQTRARSLENEEMKSRSLLETMREEIRLENERMADATKSLMMEEDFLPEKFRNNGNSAVITKEAAKPAIPPSDLPIQSSSQKVVQQTSFSYVSDKGKVLKNKQIFSRSLPFSNQIQDIPNTSNIYRQNGSVGISSVPEASSSSLSSVPNCGAKPPQNYINFSSSLSTTTGTKISDGDGIPLTSSVCSGVNSVPPVVVQFKNTRSFSLRQSSTDSIGSEGSDNGSPDGAMPLLQRAMSCDSVSSDTSIVLGDLEPPHVTGSLCIGLEYDSETADLLVNVVEAKELEGSDPSTAAPFDSYVRVYLLPDKTTNMQTRVYRKSLNPVYREKFMFGLETMELPLRTLVFYLYATDKRSNTLVGEAELRLRDLDIYQPTTTWLQLTDTGQRGGESGEIMFSLSYLPTAERLTVVVVKARSLKFPHERETGDPFVKVYLLQKGKKVSKKKSSTKRGERNPIFNEAMIFSVPAHALQTIQLRITVADSSEIEGRAFSVGHVIVGSSAAGKSLSHWNQMLSSLRKPIAMWHPLRK